MSTASPTSPPTTDPWFQDRFAERIGGAGYGKGTEVYKFELIKRAKRLALAEHPERKMLDFGIGENDEMAPESVRDVMRREIDRPEKCHIKYLDYYGQPKEIQAEGMLATCIQHEMDHLEGVLFIDYLSKLKKTMIVKKLSKQKNKADRIIV